MSQEEVVLFTTRDSQLLLNTRLKKKSLYCEHLKLPVLMYFHRTVHEYSQYCCEYPEEIVTK